MHVEMGAVREQRCANMCVDMCVDLCVDIWANHAQTREQTCEETRVVTCVGGMPVVDKSNH